MAYFIKIFCLISSIFNFFDEFCEIHDSINISDYNYNILNEENDQNITICILGTNDIHGKAFPLTIMDPSTKKFYSYGGLEYLGTYIEILRNEYKHRFLWFDGGDYFQGGLENRLSNGSIITDFYNQMELNGGAIGNHEFDFNQTWLKTRMSSSNFTFLAANVLNNDKKPEFLPNTKVTKLYKVGDITIGVIGLSTVATKFTTAGDLSGISFEDYRDLVISYSKQLKEEGAHTIVLVSHIGTTCPMTPKDKFTLMLRDKDTNSNKCGKDGDEMNQLLGSLDEGVVDLVVGGHKHDIAHHWINGIPVVQNINQGTYAHVFYLKFDKKTKKLHKEEIKIEGPLPVCSHVYTNYRNCESISAEEDEEAGKLRRFHFHGKLVTIEQKIFKLFEKWVETLKKYREQITLTSIRLTKNYETEYELGNLMTNCMADLTNSEISVINTGTFRTVWFPGPINQQALFDMFPFDNEIVSFEMTGEELVRMINIIEIGSNGFYPTKGLKIKAKVDELKKEIISVKQFNCEEIKMDKVYKVATVDFLAHGGDDFKDVVTWYKPRNLQVYQTLRDSALTCLKKIPEINKGSFIDPENPRLEIIK